MLLLASTSPLSLIDWPSLGWVALLGALTFACLAVKSRFEAIAGHGRVAEVLAHVVVGYFSVGMTLFGATAAWTGYFPVPGGTAWEGAIAVVGGLAAVTIGTTTLYEHLVHVMTVRRHVAATVAAQGGEGVTVR